MYSSIITIDYVVCQTLKLGKRRDMVKLKEAAANILQDPELMSGLQRRKNYYLAIAAINFLLGENIDGILLLIDQEVNIFLQMDIDYDKMLTEQGHPDGMLYCIGLGGKICPFT